MIVLIGAPQGFVNTFGKNVECGSWPEDVHDEGKDGEHLEEEEDLGGHRQHVVLVEVVQQVLVVTKVGHRDDSWIFL